MGDINQLLQDLQSLLDHYAAPCTEPCDHSQCPLLRDIRVLVVNASLAKAQRTVKPIVDLERQGESVGDLMNIRLRQDGTLDLDFDPFRRYKTATNKL